jgi:hypothetical protein
MHNKYQGWTGQFFYKILQKKIKKYLSGFEDSKIRLTQLI